ncbi:MAG TPA: septal ring lytic transglycosylase RlpA family protein [Puia sp.]|nr:septal ring lytic transglycosylase RlpA family protein [Puia sp.]
MNKQIAIALFAGAMLANKAHAQKPKHHHSNTVRHSKGNIKTQYGIASFYANKFNGRRTANGEIFSQQKLTAASNTLALNTWVKVTNLHNKKSVFVRITDRMYFRNKRLIDLSKAAAHQLGYTGWGLARVKVDVIGKHKPVDAESVANK